MAVTLPSIETQANTHQFHLQHQLTLPIVLADRLLTTATDDITPQVRRLSHLLRSAVRFISSSPSSSIYHPPILRIFADVTKTLDKVLSYVRKCNYTGNGILRHVYLTLITSSSSDFKKVSNLLESSIGDLRWLLSLFDPNQEDADVSIPPIARDDPILAWVWSSIASLYRATKDRVDSASHLASLAHDNQRYRTVIVEEGGIPPLLRLLQEAGASPEEKIAAATAVLHLADVRKRTRAIAADLGIKIVVEVLGKSVMRVQSAVAEVVARVSDVDSLSREEFGRENVVKPLIGCLMMDFEKEYCEQRKKGKDKISFHSIVREEIIVGRNNNDKSNNYKVESSSSSLDWKNNESGVSPEIKRKLKINCALALSKLCVDSNFNCQKIADSKGLFCLSKIMETEKGELQLNCLMTILQIAKVAESNVELRKLAWKPSSPPTKAVLLQLLRVIKEVKDQEFRIPAIKAIGCLARIFPAKETGVISCLVTQLSNAIENVAIESAIALVKFACPDNHNCVEHSKTIIEFNGVPPLMKLLNFSERSKMNGLVLLSYLSMNVANSKALEEAGAFKTIENAILSGMAQNGELREVFKKAMQNLLLYQDGYHKHSHATLWIDS